MNRFTATLIALTFAIPAAYAQTSLEARIAQAQTLADHLTQTKAPALEQARALRTLAALQQDAALYPAAAMSFAHAITLFQETPNASAQTADALDGLGVLQLETGQYAASQASLNQAHALRLAAHDTLNLARTDVHLANLAQGQHLYRQAETLAAQSLQTFNETPAADTLDRSSALIALSLALCSQNRSAEALPILHTLVTLTRQTWPENSIPVGMARFLLGLAEGNQNDLTQADTDMQQGLQSLEATMPPAHPMLAQTRLQYAHLLRKTGRLEQAQVLEAQAATTQPQPQTTIAPATHPL